jgi:predicted phage baseplate assembly protein
MSAALPCGCCEPGAPATPEALYNRPGLPRLAYRCGTFASFREAMIEAAAEHPELRAWTARSSEDFGVALLECWAYVADVLTFYTEQTANESFLGTARLRESVLRLAALVGHRPMPGLSAVAHLAFELEPDAELELPSGLRVKSVPEAEEAAVTFETDAPLRASGTLNAVPIWANVKDRELWPRDGGPVSPTSRKDALAAFPPGTACLLRYEDGDSPGTELVEEKAVTSLEARPPVLELRFEPPLRGNPVPPKKDANPLRLVPVGRRFRLFGHDAPQVWIKAVPKANGEVEKFERLEAGGEGYSLAIANDKALPLDRVVDRLEPDTRVMVVTASGLATEAKISTVTAGGAERGPLSATVTEIELEPSPWDALGDNHSVREVTIYELAGPEITLWGQYFPGAVEEPLVLTPLPVDPPALEAGREVILEDGSHEPLATTVIAVKPQEIYGEWRLLLTLKDPPLQPLGASSARLRANVVSASHGETVAAERLGAGDAAASFQRLQLGRRPLTRVPRPGARYGAGAELELRVGGLLWHEAEELIGHAAADRVYAIETADDGTAAVRFGDGETGMRPASGAEIVARYRHGLGRAGRVAAGRLSTLLDRPRGLSAVDNPLPAEGGAEPETLEGARGSAPATVRTLGRVVSLRDFEDAAREAALVAKARAMVLRGAAGVGVSLTVAGEDGARLGKDSLTELREDLDARRDPHRRLLIQNYTAVAVAIEAKIVAYDPDRQPDAIEAAAREALLDAFCFERRELGQALHRSDVLAVLQGVSGVVGVDLDRFDVDEAGANLTPAPHKLFLLTAASVEVSVG